MKIDTLQMLKLLSDETRLRCLVLLYLEGELCVCELTCATGLSQPKISRHLASLREAGIVQYRRAGTWIYYALHADLPGWSRQIIQSAADGSRSAQPYAADLARLATMPNRPASACCA
jgi:ArsR family transcriptional regulator